jgi:ADP-ribose pyrophosphatase YjhB (NUDIX family)
MASDIHALIRAFLQQQNVVSLVELSPLVPDSYTKAGLVPFLNADGLSYYFMKPKSSMPERGEPPFQLCKGTRQHFQKGKGWRDIKESLVVRNILDKETLAETAIREGVEELGLELPNIVRLFDLGGFEFSSTTTGKKKYMWLFAAEIKDRECFMSAAQIADTTEARKWLPAEEFAVAGREDHRYIVEEMETRLRRYFKI